MYPDRLAAWSGVELLEPLAGGARNQVFLARRGRGRLVVRRSGRPPASLEWELDLLELLRANGVLVPEVVPADDAPVDRSTACCCSGSSRAGPHATAATGGGWWRSSAPSTG
jgi:hypothetical protein